MRSYRVPLAVTLAAATLAVLACSGNEKSSDGSSLTAMLALVPDTPGTRERVIYGNLAAVRQAAGFEAGTDVESELRQLNDVGPQSWFVSDPFRITGERLERSEFGFHITEINASIDAGVPPDRLALFRGRIDAEQVDRALTTFEPWADELTTGEQGDLTTYVFGDESGPDLERITPGRRIGESLRIGVGDGTVWHTTSDELLDDVAGLGDDGTSLADVEGVAEVAEVLDEAGAHTVGLTTAPDVWVFDPLRLVPGATPEQIEVIEQRRGESALTPWDVAAVGDVFADGVAATGSTDATGNGSQPSVTNDYELMIVLWHADDDDAAENEAALERALTEGVSFITGESWSRRCQDPEVNRDGGLVTARCHGVRAGATLQIFSSRDLLLHR